MNERLRKARAEAGMTMQALADAVGIALRTYQRLEAGDRLPQVDVALKLAAALNVKIEKLFDKE